MKETLTKDRGFTWDHCRRPNNCKYPTCDCNLSVEQPTSNPLDMLNERFRQGAPWTTNDQLLALREIEQLRGERDSAQKLAQFECAARHESYAECDRLRAAWGEALELLRGAQTHLLDGDNSLWRGKLDQFVKEHGGANEPPHDNSATVSVRDADEIPASTNSAESAGNDTRQCRANELSLTAAKEQSADETTERQAVRQLTEEAQERGEYQVADGFGNIWNYCARGKDCRLQVVRPGKVQCDCWEEAAEKGVSDAD